MKTLKIIPLPPANDKTPYKGYYDFTNTHNNKVHNIVYVVRVSKGNVYYRNVFTERLGNALLHDTIESFIRIYERMP